MQQDEPSVGMLHTLYEVQPINALLWRSRCAGRLITGKPSQSHVGHLPRIEIEKLRVSEHRQLIIEIKIVRAGALQVLRRGHDVEVGNVLGHVG